MREALLTAGQFAKLARTTKRTVLWYAEKGILAPYTVDDSGYRFYKPEQIIDFQSALLMRKLGFSIADIALLLAKGNTLRRLFEQKRGAIERQIGELQYMLATTNRYYHNLDVTGTLVQPELKQVRPYDIYYIAKEGPYARIPEYTAELRTLFVEFPEDAVRLTAFMEPNYQPVHARMKIGVIYGPHMRLKPGAAVMRETVPAYQALVYRHQGSVLLLSLLWQELGKYRRKQHVSFDTRLPFADVEFYREDTSPYPDPQDSLLTELHMPVTGSVA